MALDESVIASVANTNFKTIAEGPARLVEMQMQNLTAHQQQLQTLQVSNVGKIAETMNTLDPLEAAGVRPISGTTEAAATALAQIITKLAQSTPPETATEA